LAAGCGDDGRAPVDLGGGDMAGGDTIAPSVRGTTPAEGDVEVRGREPFVVRFTEPMNTASGSLTADPGGPIPMARWRWNDVGSTLTVEPNTPWAQGTVTITIEGFEDPAGNVMEEPVEVTFETIDDVPPFVTSATPDEGETGVSARLEAIELSFSEPMDTSSGVINVLGGAATVSEPEWSGDGMTVTFPVADIEYDREYDVGLGSFRDERGNALDGEPVVEDGFLDFSTGADTDPPRALRSEPMEGQVDVNPATQPQIEVVFDEAMDTDVTSFTLDAGGTDVTVDGSWSTGARVLTVAVDGVLEFDTSYSLDLTGLTDRLGNALDGSAYLGDGRLDFVVSEDAFDPVVLSSTPVEGATNVDRNEALPIQVVFSEAMDTSVTSASLTGGTSPIALEGTWASATVLDFEVPADTLAASTAYQLDLTGFEDLTGNATDATHDYLGDGVLDFTTASPFGESCLDPLTEADAIVAAGVTAWTVRAGRVTSREGGTDACADYTGSATRPDVVIRYEKTSGDVGSGGRLLRIVADADTTSTEYDIAVIPGACDATATPARCIIESEVHQLYADVPAGPVHIWVSPNSSSTFSSDMAISVEEVDPPRAEGESCDAPYTTSSSIFSSSGGVDTFLIPAGMGPRAMDIADFTVTDGSLVSCDPTTTSTTSSENGTGVDAVIQYTMPADAVLRVTAEGLDSSSNPEFNVSVHDRCALDASATEYGCIPDVSTTAKNGIVEAPAGDIFLWLTNTTTDITRSSISGDYYFHEARIDIEPIPVDAGETCSRAFAASAGTTAVTGSADVAVLTPSCFDAASAVEWYAFTASQPLAVAGTDAAGSIALFQDSDELACSADGSTENAVTFVRTGETVCVAVEMGQGITELDLDERSYTGVGTTDPVSLPIEPPLNAGTVEFITGDSWMSGNDSVLVMAYGTEMLDALRNGAGATLYRGASDGLSSSNMGNAGLFAANGALFSFDDTTVGGSRVYRLWDGSSPFYGPVAWDVPAPTYPSEEISAATVVGNTIYYVTADDFPIFYSIDATASGTAARLGTNETITDVVGLAADDTYLYVAGALTDGGTEGIFRIPFTELSDESYTPPNLAPGIDHDGTPFPSREVAMYVDGVSAPGHLYVRNDVGHVEVIVDPASGSPLHLGEIIRVGTSSDEAMWLDPATGALYLFETESDSDGSFLRFDP
jgi:hypothetical protein